jgi:hypothetical protein
MAAIIVFGSLAIAGTVWQGREANDESRALAGTTAPPESSIKEHNKSALFELNKQVKALEDRVRELEASRRDRTITQETAEKMAAYLKQFGNHRVIVSCIPDDMESYQYANQILNILKAANWDVQGPEVTKIFGDVRARGINIYANGDGGSETITTLLNAFAKFNIPYQPRVTPSQAIPDSETVELFIGAQPSEAANTGAE